jgi:hypothetical protein
LEDAIGWTATPEFILGAFQVAKEFVRLVLAVLFAIAELVLVNAHPVGASLFRFGAVPEEIQAGRFIRIVTTIIVMITPPPARDAPVVVTPEIGGITFMHRCVLTVFGFVFIIFTVGISVTFPVHWDTSSSRTLEMCVRTSP